LLQAVDIVVADRESRLALTSQPALQSSRESPK
jgi:hypothetical protein